MTQDLLDIDAAIADPSLYADPDRYYPLFRELRAKDPVRWTAPEGFRPFWLISRYDDIMEIERRHTEFLNAPRATLKPKAMEEELAAKQAGHKEVIRSMNNMDGEEHRAIRGITSKEFLLPSVQKLTGQLDEVAAEFVDRMIAKGPECDFVTEVALWYPLRVIMAMLGVPKEDEAKLLHLTLSLFNDAGSIDPDAVVKNNKIDAAQAFFDYFRPFVDNLRKNPDDGIASKIANARIDGKPLGDFETCSYFLTIATAGHDTTSSTIAGGLLALMQFPDQMALLRADPAALQTAPDEMMRWTAPVKHFFRTAARDCEIGGKAIRAGDNLMLAFPSGCRDESVFDNPDAFRVDRKNNRHLALGSGVHACLGQHLARLEVRLFFRHLLERIDHIELAGTPTRTQSLFISGLTSLPVRFTTR